MEEYLRPIYASDAQLVVCILGPDYPKQVWTKFESDQFKQRFKSGEVILIVLSSAPLGVFDSATKVGHIPWDRSGNIAAQVRSTAELLRKCVEPNSKDASDGGGDCSRRPRARSAVGGRQPRKHTRLSDSSEAEAFTARVT